MFLLFLFALNTDTSEKLCNLVNSIRINNGIQTLDHSVNMRFIAETHINNLIYANYDPFLQNECDPHSWFSQPQLNIESCCYPLENCMGNKGNQLFNYNGITIENIHAERATGGFFGGQITTSGITPESSVNGWKNSPLHLRAMLSSQKICGGAITEYKTIINSNMYYITGIASLWLGSVNDSIPFQPTSKPTIQPIIQPTPNPTSQPTPNPTIQPTSNPTIQPTPNPTIQPTNQTTSQPTSNPSSKPTNQTTSQPTPKQISQPTSNPSIQPTPNPTSQPTSNPTISQSQTKSEQGNTIITIVFSSIILAIILTVILIIVAWTIKKNYFITESIPEQKREIIMPQSHKKYRKRHRNNFSKFHILIREMLDPNDPDDIELLEANTTRQMANIIKNKKYLDN